MNKKLLSLLMLISIILAVSCAKDEPETATLTLSAPGLQFDKNGGEQSLTITTNQEKWNAIATGDAWLTLTPSGNTLKITATANTTTAARKATLLVMAGATQQAVEIEQTAADAQLELKPAGKTVFDQWESTLVIDVEGNTDSWTAEVNEEAASWLSVEAKPYKRELIVRVAENTKRAVRTGKILVKAQGKMQEVEIMQNGIIHYLIPMLKKGAAIAEVKAFEAKRRSEYNGEAMDGIHMFKTISPAVPTIAYLVSEKGMVAAAITAAKIETFAEKEFIDFLNECGFTYIYKDRFSEESIWWNAQQKATATIDTNSRIILFQFADTAPREPKQDKDMPTWKTFPWGMLDFEKADATAIRAFETKNGGKELPESTPEFLRFEAKPDFLLRAYSMNDNDAKLEEKVYLCDKISLALFKHPANNRYYPTAEFEKLMKDEGCVFARYEEEKNEYTYNNVKRKTSIRLKVGKFKGYADPLLGIFFKAWEPDGNAQRMASGNQLSHETICKTLNRSKLKQ